MASAFENKEATLSMIFDEQLKIYHNIENSDLPSTSDELKDKVLASIKKLEELTVSISYLGVFSSNETFDEIPTGSIKFLLLPALLGALTLKLHKSEREEVLKVASVYFKDFLKRCSNYELTNYSNSNNDDGIKPPESQTLKDSRQMPDFKKMAKQREEKIARFKKKKSLGEKLDHLKKNIENPNSDEEIMREYYLTMINQFICQSFDELESISIELNMLQQVKHMNVHVNKENRPFNDEAQVSKPLQPFLITKDDIQKKVFGAGYPSLPVMTVGEFYEQRVKEGWFPPPLSSKTQITDTKKTREDENKEDEEEEDIEKLRQRDEWRDTHRIGWGNTYNRS